MVCQQRALPFSAEDSSSMHATKVTQNEGNEWMTKKQDASIEGVRFSPQKPAVVTISKDGSFKKLVSPVDEHFFDEFKEVRDAISSAGLVFMNNPVFGAPLNLRVLRK